MLHSSTRGPHPARGLRGPGAVMEGGGGSQGPVRLAPRPLQTPQGRAHGALIPGTRATAEENPVLALKMTDRAMSHAMQMVLEAEKRPGNGLSPGAFSRQPCRHLDFSPARPIPNL